MKPRMSLITLGVADMARAIDFYQNGLKLPRHPFPGDGVAFFALNGTWLALYPRANLARDAGLPPEGQGFAGITLAHNVATREEVEAVLAEALAAGATLIKGACDTFYGGYTGYFADPDGFIWEIAWVPHFWIGPAD